MDCEALRTVPYVFHDDVISSAFECTLVVWANAGEPVIGELMNRMRASCNARIRFMFSPPLEQYSMTASLKRDY